MRLVLAVSMLLVACRTRPDEPTAADASGSTAFRAADFATSPSCAWTAEPTSGTENLWAVWGRGPNDVFAAGDSGTIFHSTGNGIWNSQPVDADSIFFHLWGISALYVSGTRMPDASPSLFVSTGDGAWSPLPLPPSCHPGYPIAIAGSAPNDVYFAGAGCLLHSNGDGALIPLPSGTELDGFSLWAASADELYEGGYFGTVLHSSDRGMSWQQQTMDSDVNSIIYAIWGSGPNDIYAVGGHDQPSPDGFIFHSRGDGEWTYQLEGKAGVLFTGVWGSSATDVYVAGAESILHSAGDGMWQSEQTGADCTGTAATSVWGSGANDVYATSGSGVLHKK